jgi:hypothetical protein
MPLLRKLRHQLAKSPLRDSLVWVRHKPLKASDVFFASYPRSGSTWLRFLLFDSIVGEPSGFQNVNYAIPDVKLQEHGLPLMPGGGRLIKTHEIYHRQYRKAVYLVRDPRDVALSEYAYQSALGIVNVSLDDYLRKFVTEGVNPFASWRRHVDSWLSASLPQEQLLIARFEDLRADAFNGLVHIVEFLGLTPDERRIRAAIANNTVEKMRAKEKETPQRASARGRFIRSGSAGGWRNTLTHEQAQLFRQHNGEALTRMGYSLDAERVESVTA